MMSDELQEFGPGNNNIIHILYMKSPELVGEDNLTADKIHKISFTFN